MADLGKLQIQISANMAPLVANLAEAEKMTRSFGSVSETAYGQVQKATAGATAQVAGLTKAMADQVTKTAAANNNIKLTGMQVQNLGYQVNDVATMLAMGASPFQIIASQAGQVVQALGDGPGGVKGSLQAVGVSLAGMAARVGPVGLALGVATAAAGAFWLMSGGKEADQAQAKVEGFKAAIDKLRESFSDAAGAADAFMKDSQRQIGQDSTLGQLQSEIDGAKAKMKAAVDQLGQSDALTLQVGISDSFGAVFDLLNGDVRDARAELQDLYAEFTSGKLTAAELVEEVSKIQIGPDAPESVRIMAEEMRTLGATIRDATAESGALQAAYDRIINSRDRLAVPAEQDKANRQRSEREFYLSNPVTRDDLGDKLREQAEQLEADAKREAKAARGPRAPRARKPADDYAKEVQQIQQRSAAMQEETFIQAGLSARVDDYGYALTKARIERDLANAAEKQGLEITPEMAANIGELAEGYAQATVARQKLTDAQDQARQSAEDLQNLEKDGLNGFITDMRNGVSAGEALSNVFDKIIDKIQNDLVDALFSANGAASGGGGGGFLSSIFGLFTGGGAAISAGTSAAILGGAQGLFSRGGYTGDGSPTDIAGMVHGKEYVLNARATQSIGRGTLDAMNAGISIPKTIALPASASAGAAMSGGASSYVSSPTFTIDARGAQQGVAEEIEQRLNRKFKEYEKGEPARFLKARENAFKRTGR